MTMHPDLPSAPIHHYPNGGRVCIRPVEQGEGLVGVMQFSPDFTPAEGKAYLLFEHPDGAYSVMDTPVADGIPQGFEACTGVGELMTSPIWPKTLDPSVRVVRFLQAFPAQNRWTIYGVSFHPSKPNMPTHQWRDIDHSGKARDIEPPFDAKGSDIGQILSCHAVWPDEQGIEHTLPEMPMAWRKQYHRYHEILVDAAHDERKIANLPKTLSIDPYLRHLSLGKIDPEYCRFLAALKDDGMLAMEAPRSADEDAKRLKRIGELVRDKHERPYIGRRPAP